MFPIISGFWLRMLVLCWFERSEILLISRHVCLVFPSNWSVYTVLFPELCSENVVLL